MLGREGEGECAVSIASSSLADSGVSSSDSGRMRAWEMISLRIDPGCVGMSSMPKLLEFDLRARIEPRLVLEVARSPVKLEVSGSPSTFHCTEWLLLLCADPFFLPTAFCSSANSGCLSPLACTWCPVPSSAALRPSACSCSCSCSSSSCE